MPNPAHHTKLPKPKAAAAESPQQSPAPDGSKKQGTAAAVAVAPAQDPSRISRKRKASGVLESSQTNVAKSASIFLLQWPLYRRSAGWIDLTGHFATVYGQACFLI